MAKDMFVLQTKSQLFLKLHVMDLVPYFKTISEFEILTIFRKKFNNETDYTRFKLALYLEIAKDEN